MQGDAGRRPYQLEHHVAVFELFKDVARLSGPWKAGEPRPAGADAPRRHGNAKRHRPFGQLLDVDAAPDELTAEVIVVVLKRLEALAVVGGNLLRVELERHYRLAVTV